MAELDHADCDCTGPCSCLLFEGKVFAGLESIIDHLVEQLELATAIAETTLGLEAERDDLLDYVRVLETQLKINEG